MRRLHPGPSEEVAVEAAYGAPLGERPDRPWVGLCMVASIDGSTVVDETSGRLSNPTDISVLQQLRSIADTIIVGAGTVRTEGYGLPKGGQRIGVVTGSGNVDFDSDLFRSGCGFVITDERRTFAVPDGVDVLRAGASSIDLDRAIRLLPDVVGRCRVVQAEGGATLNGALLDADLLDEINVTTSSAAVGGAGARLTMGAGPRIQPFDVAHLAIDEMSFVYTRWLRRRG